MKGGSAAPTGDCALASTAPRDQRISRTTVERWTACSRGRAIGVQPIAQPREQAVVAFEDAELPIPVDGRGGGIVLRQPAHAHLVGNGGLVALDIAAGPAARRGVHERLERLVRPAPPAHRGEDCAWIGSLITFLVLLVGLIQLPLADD